MGRKILIVEDNEVNRLLLKNILEKEYDTLEAADGEVALALLEREYDSVSAVLLDIMMPVMDGFELLARMRDDLRFASIPVVVATGSKDETAEVRAIALGANDFITKPYNPTLILHSLRNTINLRETASIVKSIQRDKLTGLYNRETFFDKVEAALARQEPGYYVFSCFDIKSFKLINEQYGTAEGDRILRYIGETVESDMAGVGGIGGRIFADNFATLYPASELPSNFVARLKSKDTLPAALRSAMVISVGRYIVTDTSLPASAIYDRANLAKLSVKGRYDEHIAYFDETMRERLLREQVITGDMETALARRQFEVWFQPQYNHSTGALIGAEALVRWRHPQRGLIQPGEFIPVFEQNGFVYALDRYVWAEACRYLRKWIDEGQQPLPVSVNISRYDVFCPDLMDAITGLIVQYDIPVELLRLEITESAFAESTEQIVGVVRKLVERGFTVEIDDFGSGYSSLNTLKSVPAQVVKLDMRFLEDDGGSQRGGNILESIVRMAKWLGMTVIAEGVEEKAQADFLKTIGCNYVQGYLYARPMTAADYETVNDTVADSEREDRFQALETVENLDNNTFWDPRSMDTLIFNSYIGSACIFEYYNDELELLRANDKYIREFSNGDQHHFHSWELAEHMDTENYARLADSVRRAIESGRETTFETCLSGLRDNGGLTYIRATVRAIARAGQRHLLYCAIFNTTAQRQAEAQRLQAAEQLEAIMRNINGGVTVTVMENDGARILYANDEYFAQLGYTREQLRSEVPDVFALVHPDDREDVRATTLKASLLRQPFICTYRVLRGDGELRWMQSKISIMDYPGTDQPVQLAVANDVTEQMRVKELQKDLLDHIPGGAALFELRGETLTAVHLNKRYKELVGREPATSAQTCVLDAVHPDDRAPLMAEMQLALREKRDMECSLRLLCENDAYRSFRVVGRSIPRDNDVMAIYAVFTPIANDSLSYQQMLPVALATVMRSSSDLAFVKDSDFRYICCSRSFAQMAGLTEEKDVIGKRDEDFVSAEYAKKYRAVEMEIIKTGQARLDYEEILPSPDSSVRYGSTSKYPLLDDGGNVIGIYGVTRDITEYHTAQQATRERLRLSEEEYRMAMKHSGNVIGRYNVAEGTVAIPEDVAAAFSIPPTAVNVPDGPVRRGEISPETAKAYIRLYEAIRRGKKTGTAVFQKRSYGGWCWLEANFSTIFADNGEPVSAVISYRDITRQREKEAIYNRWRQSLRDRDPASYSLFRCNISQNLSFYSTEGALLHIDYDPQIQSFDQRTREYAEQCVYQEDKEKYLAFLKSDTLLASYYRGQRAATLEYRERRPNGGVRWLRLSVELVEYPDCEEIEASLMFEDIDEAKRTELLTIERAETDPLTGVLNRVTFAAGVERLIRSAGPDQNHALLMVDIDRFKQVNDAFGHGAGDRALIDIADALRSVVRRGDLLGRLGGDEFMVFLANISNDTAAANKAAQIGMLVRRSFSDEVSISASIGIAVYPRDGESFEELYQKVDGALYHTKNTGKDGFIFYHEEMDDNCQLTPVPQDPARAMACHDQKRRMLIVDDNRIDNALLAGIFEDEYIIDKARDGNTALVRLRHYGTAVAVVLLDLVMPGIDGFAVLEQMQNNDRLRSIPVVVVSGYEDRDTVLRAIRGGATDFVTKPVDPELLRHRVSSAVKRAENDRLRLQNTNLLQQNSEVLRCRTVLERTGIIVIEYDWVSGAFIYDPLISAHLAGTYDNRKLWHILLSDMVTDVMTVKRMQGFVHEIAEDKKRMEGSLPVQLKTPEKKLQWFRMTVYKLLNEFQLTDKLLLTFQDDNSHDSA